MRLNNSTIFGLFLITCLYSCGSSNYSSTSDTSLNSTQQTPFNLEVLDLQPHSALVTWKTHRPLQSEIRYRVFESGETERIIIEEGAVSQHEVYIEGLEPDTRYAVKIENYSFSFQTLKTDSIFDYPTRPLIENLPEELYPVHITPFANSIPSYIPEAPPRDKINYFSIENKGTQKVKSPFLYSPREFNITNLLVLKHQIQALTANPEEQLKYLWYLVATHVEHYCAAGDVGFFARAGINLLNSYGFGCCDNTAVALASISRIFGYLSRQTAINGGGGHSMTEIYYDDNWHLFDADKKAYYPNGTNEIASFTELMDNPDLLDNAPLMRELLDSTTLYEFVPISREEREETDYPPHTTSLIEDLTLNALPFHLFPGEKIEFFLDPGDMPPATLFPYVENNELPNYAKGTIHVNIGIERDDPRIVIDGNKLYLYLLSAFPLRQGNISIKFLDTPSSTFSTGIYKGQHERHYYNLDQSRCLSNTDGTCTLEISIAQALETIKRQSSDLDPLHPYPFTSMPKYYLLIESSHKIRSRNIVEIRGALDFQISQAFFPLQENIGSYLYRDLNPGCEKNIDVTLENQRQFNVKTPMQNTSCIE